MKTQLPVKLKVGVAILFCLVLWTANSWYKAGWIGNGKEDDIQKNEYQNTIPTQSIEQGAVQNMQDTQELTVLEQKHALEQAQRRIYLYSTQLPKDYEIIKQDPNLQVRSVIANKNKCVSYNTHGDLMNLSYKECTQYLEYGRVHKPTQTQIAQSIQGTN